MKLYPSPKHSPKYCWPVGCIRSLGCATLFAAALSAQALPTPQDSSKDASKPAQSTADSPAQSPQSTVLPSSENTAPHGTVLFERSAPAPDTIPDQAPAQPALKQRVTPAPQPPATKPAKPTGPIATDAERAAITFVSYDLDIRLVPNEASLAVRAKITVRNDGQQPLTRLPLQISSSLTWLGFHSDNKRLAFTQRLLDSDVDHTGTVDEALVTLPNPLPPASSMSLEVIYSGQVTQDAERLERIGAPHDQAFAADWDRISPDFTGLRGFGNVLWYPVVSEALELGDGARLFNGVDAWKQRQSAATVSMRVQVEYRSNPPSIAVLDGQVVPNPQDTTTQSSSSSAPADSSDQPPPPRIATFILPPQTLGFQAPNLFLFSGQTEQQDGLRLWFNSADTANTQAYFAAAAQVLPLYQDWFSPQPRNQLTLIDLPEDNDQVFNAGSTLFLPLKSADPSRLTPVFSSALAAAWFRSPRIWMSEGLAQFMSLLWTQRSIGRAIAYEQLEAQRSALALVEPETPGDSAGQSLEAAREPIYYRTKAAYVWWMLRGLVGDKPLQAALRQYRADQDTQPDYFEHLLETASGKDLRWFFDDWVYHDRGLPDLTIKAVVPRKVEMTGDYLVAVEVANAGYATAEVPVTINSGPARVTEQLRIPGRSSTTTRILIQGVPDSVDVNDGSVPEISSTTHRKEILGVPSQP